MDRSHAQSKSTMPQPSVVFGSVKPVLLQGMMIVERFSCQVCFIRGSVPGQVFGHSHAASANVRSAIIACGFQLFDPSGPGTDKTDRTDRTNTETTSSINTHA